MSNSEWKEYEMSELIEEISMGPFGSNIKVECFTDSGVPVLNGSNLVGFRLNEDSFNYVTEEKATSLGKANAYRGDIVITHRGTLGQIVYIPQNSKYSRYVISQSQFRVRCNEKVIPEYLVYYFHSRLGQHKLLSNASQVGVPSLARPTSTFQKLTVSIPPIAKQKEIVKILSSLDDKIELNNAINRNLEEQAKAIFNSVYDKAVNQVPFTSIISIASGGTPRTSESSFWNGNIPFFTPKDVGVPFALNTEKYITDDGLNNCNSRLYPTNTTFITARGTVGKLSLAAIPMAMNQSCFALVSERMNPILIYMYAIRAVDSLKKKSNGAVFDAITIKDFETERVNKLSDEEIKSLSSVIEPIYNQIRLNTIENHSLSDLRDSLLPKLMSGDLGV